MMNLLLPIIVGLLLLGLLGWIAWLTVNVRRTAARLDTEIRARKRAVQEEQARRESDQYRLDQSIDSIFRKISQLEAQKAEPTWKRPTEQTFERECDHSSNRSDDASSDNPGQLDTKAIGTLVEDRAAEVVQSYNSLAAAFDPQRRDQFVELFHPRVCSFEGGELRNDPDGNLWVIKVEETNDLIVVPIGKVARDWDKLYRKMQGMTAKSEFGELFAFTEGGRFKLEAPARATERFGRIELAAKGHLTGI